MLTPLINSFNSHHDKGERTISLKALKMCTENLNLQCFDQNNVKFYDNNILLTVLCIFWPEFGLKPHNFSLRVMEDGKDF